MKKTLKIMLGLMIGLLLIGTTCPLYAATQKETEKKETVKKVTAPKKLETRVKGTDTIVVSWDKVYGAEKYKLYRRCTGQDGYKLIKNLDKKQHKYVDTNLENEKRYVYKLEVVGKKNTAVVKSDACALPIKAPANSTAARYGFYLNLKWDLVKDANCYEIYRAEKKDGNYKLIAKTKDNFYTDKKVVKSTRYYYKLKARTSTKNTVYRSDFSKIFAGTTSNIDKNKPIIALTFDDGPSVNTPTILKALKKYDAHATFFVVGNRVGEYGSYVKQAYAQGCEIGNHSWDHANLGISSQEKIKTEISKTDDAVRKVIGVTPTIIRPPYGSVGSNLRTVAGKPLIIWSVDTLDWKYRNASSVYGKVVGKVKDGDVILMHDLYGSTATAVTNFVPVLHAKGYQMVTVSELAIYQNQKLEAGQTYHSIRK